MGRSRKIAESEASTSGDEHPGEDTATIGEPAAVPYEASVHETRYKAKVLKGHGAKRAQARERNKKRKLGHSDTPQMPQEPPEDPEAGYVPGTSKHYMHYPRGTEPSELSIKFKDGARIDVFPSQTKRLYQGLELAANTPEQHPATSGIDQTKPGSDELHLLQGLFPSKGEQSHDSLAAQAVKHEPAAGDSLLTDAPEPEDEETPEAQSTRKRKLSTAFPPSPPQHGVEDEEEGAKSEDESGDNKAGEHNRLDIYSPPLSDINHIFSEISQHAVEEGLFEALEVFKQKGGVRIVTMCSGTEAPFVALDLIRKSLPTSKQRDMFKYQHLGSAEIEPWKQAFILRNFRPPLIFRDVTDFDKHAKYPENETLYPVTAYGKRVKPPQGAHILVAGSSCVDYSSLNKLKGEWDGERGHGESAKTMNGIGAYAKMYTPTVIIIENVSTAPWEQIKFFWKKKGYATVTVKLSSVDFYLPQTRQRGYLFGVHMKTAEKFGFDVDQAHKEWVHLMAGFQRRASSPYTDFTLREDDPRLQLIDDNAVDNKKKAGSTDWVQCRKRHVNERVINKLGIGTPYTKRREHTQASLDDYANQTWALKQSKRILDVLDIRQLDYVVRRDYDMRFKNRNINVSQNVDRDRDLRQWGIVGCVTPNGCLFETRRGGPLSGLEVLALQGFPTGDLQLEKYTSGQLQDLAGNAMSTTVIGPAILSAIMACFRVSKDTKGPEIFQATVEKPHNSTDEECPLEARFDEKLLETNPKSNALVSSTTKLPKVEVMEKGEYSLATITARAGILQPLCRCEGLHRRTTKEVLYCPDCYYTCCKGCSRDKHGHKSLIKLEMSTANRPIAASFVQFLLGVLPAVLKTHNSTGILPPFARELAKETQDRVSKALQSLLHFQGIKFEGPWKAVYESEFALLELVFLPNLRVCEGSCVDHDKPQLHLDVVPMWLLFAKAPKNEPTESPMRDKFKHPIASMRPGKKLFNGTWKVWDGPDQSSNVHIVGVGEQTASWERGLEVEENCLANLNRFSKLKISYSPPGSRKAQQLLEDIEGVYELLPHCPAPSGSLHRRVGGEKGPCFLFLQSEPLRDAHHDRVVFSNQPYQLTSVGGGMVLATFVEPWRPVATEQLAQGAKVPCNAVSLWSDCTAQTLEIPLQENTLNKWVLKPEANPISTLGCINALSTILLLDLSHDKVARERLADSRELEIALERKPLALNDFGWILSHAATIPHPRDEWQNITLEHVESCTTCSPMQPLIKWVLKKNGASESVKALECPLAAPTYENALENRPKAAIALLREVGDKALLDVKINVKTIAHRVAAPFLTDLPPDSHLESLQWRLNSYDQFTPQPLFHLPKLLSNMHDPVNEDLTDGIGLNRTLWSSQSQALAWMVKQEASPSPWDETSLVESCLPALGWSLEAKALLHKDNVRGGVIADEVGAGKTTTSLALVAYDYHQISRGATLKDSPVSGKLSSDATLILVPKNILKQWENEVDECLGWHKLAPDQKDDLQQEAPYFIVVSDTKQLQKYSREQIESAALVLAPWNIFGQAAYWTDLRKIACSPCTPNDPGRAFEEWLSETLSHLATCVEGWKVNTIEFWKAWDRVRTDATTQKKYEIFAGFLTRQIQRSLIAKDRKAKAECGTEPDVDEAEWDNETDADEAGSDTESDDDQEAIRQAEVAWENRVKQSAEEQLKKELNAFRPKVIANGKRKGHIKAPPILLHMFAFRRLIVDEYTYIEGGTLLALLQLEAARRWILSGTPPTHTYDHVNTMAKLIGTQIATYDEGEGKFGFGKDAAKMSKDKSHVQELQSYQNFVSAGFKEQVYQRAKEFSERFIRKNEPDSERPVKTVKQKQFNLTPTEWITYLDVDQLALDPDRPFGKAKPSKKIDTEHEVPASIWKLADKVELTKGPDEARICSSLMLQEVWPKKKNNSQALAALENDRMKQMIDEQEENVRLRVSQLLPVFQELWYMQELVSEVKSGASFSSFIANVSRGILTDMTTVAIVERLLLFTKKEKIVPTELLSKSKKKEKCAWNDSEMRKEDVATKEFTLRMARVENHLEILMHGLRRLRFLTAVDDTPNYLGNCSRCGNQLKGATASISIFCGHALCPRCVDEPCCRSGGATAVAPAARFGLAPLGAVESTTPCSRIRAAVALVKEAVEAKEESVLVFAQFEGMKDAFLKACASEGIEECHDGFSGVAAAGAVEAFRAASAGCLVLKVDSADAAGWNLQGANHVVFLSAPVLGSVAEREAAMEQAVGRSWRPGQTKQVFVYQLVASDTNEPALVSQK